MPDQTDDLKTWLAILNNPIKLERFFAWLVPLHNFVGMHGGQMICCPFHQDDTPSAKPYEDDDGIQRLYCFGCHRQYTSYDYVKLVANGDPREYLSENFKQEELLLHARGFKFEPPPQREYDCDIEDAAKRHLPGSSGAFVAALYRIRERLWGESADGTVG